ncbi:porin [Marinobacter sp. CHS3-4]|uniref:porin n=1 Tax=Marinobacter sp. CHS3-4 TaxID=3045174 RepID=UPI0024B5006A|nr:porin [Marinobacter sp. CHS3-4]MDI9246688.1 porin [Marinobacter sp. CHS3-4]
MKKTLLASAIAAATFSGAAFAQEGNLGFYGNVQYAYSYTDSDTAGYTDSHDDNGTTLGWTHSHAISPSVEGFMKVEAEIAAADEKGAGNGLTDLDEAYIGVRGDSFGQVWIGSDDSIYESQLGDYGNWVFEYAALNTYASYTTGEGDMIQYMSPSFGGLTLSAAIQVRGNNDGYATASDGGQELPYQLGVSYSMDGLTASLVMDSNDSSADASNENSYGVSFEYAMDALVLDAYYDYRAAMEGVSAANGDFTFDGEEGRSQIGLMGTYNLGANTFRLAYEMAETDADGLEVDVLTLQALHNVSDHMYVYTEFARRNDENGAAEQERNQLNLGAVYYF